MGYSADESMVEVNIFKPSGKWYTTLAIKFLTWDGDTAKNGKLIHDAFREALLGNQSASMLMSDGMFAVCINPFHENAHPIILWGLNPESSPYSRRPE